MITFKNGQHYSRSIEAAVLGICLLEPTAFARTKLQPEYFYYDEARTIFSTLQEMHDQAIPIDLLTAADYFQRVKKITEIKDKPVAWVLCKLTNEVVSSGSLKRWCMILTEMWKTRELARATITTAPKVLARISGPPQSKLSIKTYRFLLQYVDKELIKSTISKFGSRVIGTASERIKVSSPLLVYLMSIVEPNTTWTCGDMFHVEITNDECKKRLPNDAIFTSAGWIDKTHKFPVAWR